METESTDNNGPGGASKQQTTEFQSPYLGGLFTLDFADDLTFQVPQGVIDRHPDFAANFYKRRIDLPEVKGIQAHILVHYLYTGEYQPTEPEGITRKEKCANAFITDLGVYAMSVQYGLDALAVLASVELTKLGKDLTFIEIFGILDRERFELGPGETWLAGYLVERCQKIEPITKADIDDLQADIGETLTLTNILLLWGAKLQAGL